MVKLKAEDGTVTELLEYLNHPTELIQQKIINVGASHICYRVKNADEAYQKLLSQKISLISEPELSSEKIGRAFFALDPNGIRIELVEIFE
jgi:catechol 2,3-dioxygenase-like lactoylglutathione lyase family enzyme